MLRERGAHSASRGCLRATRPRRRVAARVIYNQAEDYLATHLHALRQYTLSPPLHSTAISRPPAARRPPRNARWQSPAGAWQVGKVLRGHVCLLVVLAPAVARLVLLLSSPLTAVIAVSGSTRNGVTFRIKLSLSRSTAVVSSYEEWAAVGSSHEQLRVGKSS